MNTHKQTRHQRRKRNKYLFLVTIVGVFLLLMVDIFSVTIVGAFLLLMVETHAI